MIALVWFRNDLRIADNAALAAASQSKHPVLAVYILNEHRQWPLGAASRVWLHKSLQSLSESLLNLGITLLQIPGQPVEVLQTLISAHQVAEIYWNRGYGPDEVAESSAVKEAFSETV